MGCTWSFWPSREHDAQGSGHPPQSSQPLDQRPFDCAEIDLPDFSLDELTWLYESPVATGPLPPWEEFPTELPMPCKPLGQTVNVLAWQPTPQLGVCQKPAQGWLASQALQLHGHAGQPQPPLPQQQPARRQGAPASAVTEAHQRTALLLRYWQLTHQVAEHSGSRPQSPHTDTAAAAAHTHHSPLLITSSASGTADHRQPYTPTARQALLLAGEETGSIGLMPPTHKRAWDAMQPAVEATGQAQAQAQQQQQLAEGCWLSPRSPAGTGLACGLPTHPSMHFESAPERPRLVVPYGSSAAHSTAGPNMQVRSPTTAQLLLAHSASCDIGQFSRMQKGSGRHRSGSVVHVQLGGQLLGRHAHFGLKVLQQP